eukprot:g19045.t1
MRSPEIERPAARVVSGSGNLQPVTRQRSLVEEHPDSERVPARTVCAAFSLLVLGLLLLCVSVKFFVTGHQGALPFLALGIVVIIPGAHSSFQLYAAFRRWPGYDFGDMRGGMPVARTAAQEADRFQSSNEAIVDAVRDTTRELFSLEVAGGWPGERARSVAKEGERLHSLLREHVRCGTREQKNGMRREAAR